MTFDGTDCRACELDGWPVCRIWCSHKFHAAGVRCEVGVCIQTGEIVWINGPFKCGPWPDINICRLKAEKALARGEMVVADKGHRGDQTVRTKHSAVSKTDRRAIKKSLTRHENVNADLKNFGVLSQQFRHPIHKHGICFGVVAMCVQLGYARGEMPRKVTFWRLAFCLLQWARNDCRHRHSHWQTLVALAGVGRLVCAEQTTVRNCIRWNLKQMMS